MLLPLRTTPSVAEQEGQLIETEATGAPQKHHHTLNQLKRLQAFKFQLRPGGQQEREMRRFAGACRFVFNRALARQNENHEVGNKYIPYGKMASWLVEWKNATETQWLKDAPSQPLQQSLKDLERAYKNFFRKRAAFPRFKKRGQNDVFRYPQGVKLDQENSRIFLPKLGWMRYRNSRQVTGVVVMNYVFTLETWYSFFVLRR